MKKILLSAALLFTLCGSSQDLKRKVFDYASMKENNGVCSSSADEGSQKAFNLLSGNNSKAAVAIAKAQYESDKSCPGVYESYGYALFRSGEWMDGVAVVEEGIQKFGGVPSLIKRRSDMSLEMFQLGTGAKNIDGNSVYKAKNSELPYDEEQFKSENLRSATLDLEYLSSLYPNDENTFYLGKIYQMQGQFDRSNAKFETLTDSDSYNVAARYNIADNYLRQNNYTEAEKRFLEVLNDNPGQPEIYSKLAEVVEASGNKAKKSEYGQMSQYYRYMPDFTAMEYSQENYDLLMFFGGNEKTAKEKMDRLKQIKKAKNDAYTIDVCLMVLKLHENHGNGVEENAADILTGIGKPALEKVHLLFKSDVSTCTITNLAGIMAKLKDESSWELMAEYLPYIAQMPSTLIPPALPEKMVEFDRDRGVREILKVVKGLLSETAVPNDDPLADLAGFSQYVYYMPLEKIDRKKVLAMARELKYTDTEIAKLTEKLK
ncbi:tetratricopeptide repeat protein [Flavobacterium sp.]|uniref:tetratricopeptide repeat protein n=1 Tax=Flavobacterium sp. TaxID=239 RepID=UPI0040337316